MAKEFWTATASAISAISAGLLCGDGWKSFLIGVSVWVTTYAFDVNRRR